MTTTAATTKATTTDVKQTAKPTAQPEQKPQTQVVKFEQAREKFELACKESDAISLVQNAASCFTAVNVIKSLRDLLTDEIMKEVFMPLMNTKVGFLTDRNGRPNKAGNVAPLYGMEVVRDAIIDAICIGLLPTGNQFNIIAEKMYPTKEGYTALLRKAEVKCFFDIKFDKANVPNYAEIPVKINYEYKGEKKEFQIIATVKKDAYSSPDQLRGKAERRAKKTLYEYVTGCDFGESDDSGMESQKATPINHAQRQAQTIDIPEASVVSETKNEVATPTQTATPTPEANKEAATGTMF